MSTPNRSSTFPATQDDISRLKQTATDAMNDLGSTAAVHAAKAKGQVRELAGHIQDEGGQNLDLFKGKVSDVVNMARDYAVERPFVCVGAALAIGFLYGLSRRRRSNQ
jgi:ElaB/YqjD/DUF883 family membrane-anchored ribosome-binding protein